MNEAVITETYFMKCSDGIRLSIGMDGEDFTCCCSIVMKDNEVENQLSSLFYTIGVPNMESCVGTSPCHLQWMGKYSVCYRTRNKECVVCHGWR